MEMLSEGSIYKTILVPLDGSKRAEAILGHVEELALRYRAKVILLRVVDPVPRVMVIDTTYAQLYQQQIERQAQRAESYLAAKQGELREKGIEAQVLEVQTVKPLDNAAVLEAAKTCGALVTCEEAAIHGGLGSQVAMLLGQSHPTPLATIGIDGAFGQSGSYDALREQYGLTAHHIVRAAENVMKRKGS